MYIDVLGELNNETAFMYDPNGSTGYREPFENEGRYQLMMRMHVPNKTCRLKVNKYMMNCFFFFFFLYIIILHFHMHGHIK